MADYNNFNSVYRRCILINSSYDWMKVELQALDIPNSSMPDLKLQIEQNYISFPSSPKRSDLSNAREHPD